MTQDEQKLIKSLLDENRESIKRLQLQNQALASLLPDPVCQPRMSYNGFIDLPVPHPAFGTRLIYDQKAYKKHTAEKRKLVVLEESKCRSK